MPIDLHRLTAALRQLAPTDYPIDTTAAIDLHLFDQVESTNRTVWDLLEAGKAAGTVAIAQQQQAGRGQRGRQWQSLPGGLYLSIGLCPQAPAAIAPQLTLCSAWGIAAELRQQGVPIQLKWLNDLLLEGGKLGGVLTETRVRNGQVTQAVIGVGVNWRNPVSAPGVRLQSWLDRHPSSVLTSLEALGAIVIWGVLRGYQRWQQAGIAALLPDYEALLVNLGQQIEIDQLQGQVVGIAATGELRVRLVNHREICVSPGRISLGYDRLSYVN